MKLALSALVAGLAVLGTAHAQGNPGGSVDAGKATRPASGEALFKSSACGDCHARQTDLAAPALMTISAKYRNNPQAVSIIKATVKNGKHGREVLTMPPHSNVSDGDAGRIAEYILSLKKPAAK